MELFKNNINKIGIDFEIEDEIQFGLKIFRTRDGAGFKFHPFSDDIHMTMYAKDKYYDFHLSLEGKSGNSNTRIPNTTIRGPIKDLYTFNFNETLARKRMSKKLRKIGKNEELLYFDEIGLSERDFIEVFSEIIQLSPKSKGRLNFKFTLNESFIEKSVDFIKDHLYVIEARDLIYLKNPYNFPLLTLKGDHLININETYYSMGELPVMRALNRSHKRLGKSTSKIINALDYQFPGIKTHPIFKSIGNYINEIEDRGYI